MVDRAGVIVMILVGWYMVASATKNVLYWRMLDVHAVLGLGIFTLLSIDAAWMMISPTRGHADAGGLGADRRARRPRLFHHRHRHHSGDRVLPLASNGEATNLYDIPEIPDIGQWSQGVRLLLADLHKYAARVCAALIPVHVATQTAPLGLLTP